MRSRFLPEGWVSSDNVTNGAFNGNSAFTGNEYGQRLNSWAFFDVSAKTYTDLMTGSYYGPVTGNNGLDAVVLNAAAIADINANLLGSISFGFTNATLNPESRIGVDLGLRINGFFGLHPESSPQLVLNNAVPDAGSSLLLFGVALAGLRAARKRLL